jgi:hypothetical protein
MIGAAHLLKTTHEAAHAALARLLTLTAMVFSFAETVFASVCAPMVDMSEMGAEVMDGDDGDASPGAMDCMLMPGHGTDQDGGDRDDHCPLSPVVGQGCSAAASLPVSHAGAGPPPDHGALRTVADEARPDLLLSHGLFRPPRA